MTRSAHYRSANEARDRCALLVDRLTEQLFDSGIAAIESCSRGARRKRPYGSEEAPRQAARHDVAAEAEIAGGGKSFLKSLTPQSASSAFAAGAALPFRPRTARNLVARRQSTGVFLMVRLA